MDIKDLSKLYGESKMIYTYTDEEIIRKEIPEKELIRQIKLELYDSITSIEPEKLMKYDSNKLGITIHHVEDIQMLRQECAESLLYKILKVDWKQMADDEFVNQMLDLYMRYTRNAGHTYIDEDRQTIELKNGEVLDLSDIDKCDFNHIIDQLREFKG